jgi:hypothetical protein
MCLSDIIKEKTTAKLATHCSTPSATGAREMARSTRGGDIFGMNQTS